MSSLTSDMTLYHGSYAEVRSVDLHMCRPGKDFGQGFYLTSDAEQARRFVTLSVKKRQAQGFDDDLNGGFVSAFHLHRPHELEYHSFREASREWLHFVSANRRRGLFPDLLEHYAHFDVISGKIANDQTARTLQLYVAGAFGDPGSETADAMAIEMLLPNRLSDQFCFLTPQAIEHLQFVGSEHYER